MKTIAVNYINVKAFLSSLGSSHTSTAQTGNMWKGVRCGAHTLQLVVEDALKKSFLRDVIDSTRCISKNIKKLLQQELSSDLSGTEIDSSKISSTDDDLDILIKAREKAAEQN